MDENDRVQFNIYGSLRWNKGFLYFRKNLSTD